MEEKKLPQPLISHPYFKDKNPFQRLSFCVYMDILGFTDEIIATTSPEDEQDLLNRLYSALQVGGTWMKPKVYELESDFGLAWIAKIFTDNIVLGYPIQSGDGESEFGAVIQKLSYYQLTMALEGFFVRGGFSVGQLFVGDDVVYGKALLESYKIENSIASNPRVVLSKEVMELVSQHLKYYGNPKHSPHYSDILIDSDNQPFVNYLANTVGDGAVDAGILDRHKEKIETNLKRHESNPKIWSKYLWVANYHNYFCHLVEELDGFNEALFVDEKLAVQKPKRLVE